MNQKQDDSSLFPPIVGARNANEILRQSSELPKKKIKAMKQGPAADLFNSDIERDPLVS